MCCRPAQAARPAASAAVPGPLAAAAPLPALAPSLPSLPSARSPGKRARSSSRCEATPTGQLLVWQTRAMMQPVAIMATVPNPYSSPPSAADTSTSRPVRIPPSTRSSTRSRSPLAVRVWCTSASPISTGPPQCLMDEMGDAPVPPSWPETWMTSALALATPLATVPMPACATSLTETLAAALTWCRS